jgi:hypothetical protein
MAIEALSNILRAGVGAFDGTLQETGPALAYTSGVLTRIDYDSGNYKLFSYTSGALTQLDYVVGAVTTRKTFNYNPDGSLSSIDQTVI